MNFKQILSFLALAAALFAASFLPPEEAFKISVQKQPHASEISINLAPKIYLYKDKFKAVLNGEDITQSVELPASEPHEGQEVYYSNFAFLLPDFMAGGSLQIFFQGCSEDGLCYAMQRANFRADGALWALEGIEQVAASEEADDEAGAADEGGYTALLERGGFFGSIALFALFGLLLSFTPCVLPMLPILSAILAKKTGAKALLASVFYVLGMALAYTAAGIAAALAGASFAAIAQLPLVQLAFAGLFLLLAASSFGAFELALPPSWQRFASSGERTGGLLGAFAMGVLSALLVGPCVAAPLAGVLVYIADSHDVWLGGAALFAMAVGMGLPLIALAAGFSLVKTGPWMMQINRFFGFVLLGTAVFFARAALPDGLIFVCFILILCAFAANFSLLQMPKTRAQWLLKALLVGFLCASSFALYKGFSLGASKSAEVVEFKQILNENEINSAEPNGEQKPKFVYFTADWCENCHIYHEEIFPELASDLQNFSLLKIDLTRPGEFEKQMSAKYQVFGPPVILLMDENGKFLRKITGLESAKNLKKFLDFAKNN